MLSVTQIGATLLRSKKVEQSDFGIDKPSDTLCNLCLRPSNFTIIFRDDEKDECKVACNCMHPCKFTSLTLPYVRVNTTKTKQYSI